MIGPANCFERPSKGGGLLTGQQRSLLNMIEMNGTCLKSAIEERFPGMSPAELFYRLEQLRLLMLITTSEVSEAGVKTESYSLTDQYRRAFLAARLRPG